jgi:hypothetical protein
MIKALSSLPHSTDDRSLIWLSLSRMKHRYRRQRLVSREWRDNALYAILAHEWARTAAAAARPQVDAAIVPNGQPRSHPVNCVIS